MRTGKHQWSVNDYIKMVNSVLSNNITLDEIKKVLDDKYHYWLSQYYQPIIELKAEEEEVENLYKGSYVYKNYTIALNAYIQHNKHLIDICTSGEWHASKALEIRDKAEKIRAYKMNPAKDKYGQESKQYLKWQLKWAELDKKADVELDKANWLWRDLGDQLPEVSSLQNKVKDLERQVDLMKEEDLQSYYLVCGIMSI